MKSNKGFSLVELIVVIAIMAIIAAVAVPVYNTYITKASDATNLQQVNDLAFAVQLANAEFGTTATYKVNDNDGSADTIVVTFTHSTTESKASSAASQVKGVLGTQASVTSAVVTLTLTNEYNVSTEMTKALTSIGSETQG